MEKIKLLRDAKVLFHAGTELEVEEQEARRLLSLGLAEIKTPAKKAPAAKKRG